MRWREAGLGAWILLSTSLAGAGCRGETVETAGDASLDATPDTGDGATATDVGDATGADTTEAGPAGCAKPRGSAMATVTAGTTTYCIDVTEVTVGQFAEFLAAPGAPFDAPAFCADLALSRPAPDTNPDVKDLPVRAVQWCFAHAYCRWAGKRLCGAIGKAGSYDVPTDGRSEWTFACQNGATVTKYSYGTSYDPAACTTSGAPVRVGSAKACHGTKPPFDAVYDLLGNVAELDNGVGFLASGAPSSVHGRGGSYADGDLGCAAAGDFAFGSGLPQVGFRCCADP